MQNEKDTRTRFLLSLDDVPEGFQPLGNSRDDLLDTPLLNAQGALLVLANLYNKSQFPRIEKAVYDCVNQHEGLTSGEFIELLSAKLEPLIGKQNSVFLSVLADEAFFNEQAKDHNIIKNDTDWIGLKSSCGLANEYAEMICGNQYDRDRIATLLSMWSALGILSFEYRPVIGFIGEKFSILNAIVLNDFLSVVNAGLLYAMADNTSFCKCKNCGSFFIPSKRSDELYCPKCKSISYDEKIKADVVLSEYRKIYKTQNARKQRNSHIPEIASRFQSWAVFAKAQLLECRQGHIDLEELKKRISDDNWIREG